MNEIPAPKTDARVEDALKRRLVNRIVVAALVVVGLLGSLVMFDAIYTPNRPLPAKPAPPSRDKLAAAARPESAVPARAESPVAPDGEPQHALQVGVFGNVANAEELRAKLERNGIPSSISIEARVQVGPFRTPEGADAARAKLKELGLDGGLPVTIKN